MKRDYDPKGMLKSKGIVYFPPVESFEEALKIQKECGGVIISLEESGFLVDETSKISKLYDISLKELEIYFTSLLKEQNLLEDEIVSIINTWKEEEDIAN
ncbi:hypothetical protein EW093_00560 [Thiospirochaeta perfilievii]|uniref:Uncharacterized protein n=1 Tax=Thiospirochaeta perfilievii TaxID=252967 RepID=A0A5C1Q8P3_9SPIO|nr:hypothetical protein [Thiospirochaeta perfilievii]QEN03256.1 hypothetical protein EW093_00560 [Thiospirochaeta perfilievii]